jgi:outer membrane immunogenic protein
MLAGLGFSALALVSASAADMPPSRYIPPPRAPTYVPFFTWTGFYVGANAGYGWGQSSWTDTVTTLSTGDFDVNGAVAGGTIGYNMQLGGFIFGLEGDFDWSNIKGSSLLVCLGQCETSLRWLATGRGRVGYAFDRVLPYVTGGVAFGDVRGTVTGFGSFSSTQIGWTAGAGVEVGIAGNWTAKAEYLYVDLGKSNCDIACSGGNPFDVTFQTNLVRGGINYKF